MSCCAPCSGNAISRANARRHTVGGELTGTNPTQAVILPDDLKRYQTQLAALAGGLDANLTHCPAMTQADLAGWQATKAAIDAWAHKQNTPLIDDLGTQWLIGQSLEAGLVGWTQTAASQCGFVPPKPPPPPGDVTSGIADAAKWGAIAVIGLLGIVLVMKVL